MWPSPRCANCASATAAPSIVLSAASGAAGGAFGLASLPVELPVSTTIMLRSIADIARAEGEDPIQARDDARLPPGLCAGRPFPGPT